MRTVSGVCTCVLMLSAAMWAGNAKVLSGEISDSQCALNVHSKTRSHQEMTTTHAMGKTAEECARACVRQMGGQYVLISGEKVYKLDQQDLADKFAGQKVKVKGEVDGKAKTINVESIEPQG